MQYFDEKMTRRLAQIEKSIFAKTLPVTDYRVKEGKEPQPDDGNLRDFTTDQFWGGYGEYQWFKTDLTIPANFAGRPVVFNLYTEHEKGVSSLSTAEYTAFINGELHQGLDIFHKELILTPMAKGGETYRLELLGFSGLTEGKSLTTTKLAAVSPEAKDYYYNLRCALECTRVIDKDCVEYFDICRIINESMKLVDFREFMEDSYYASVVVANDYLKKNLYEAMSTASQVVVDAIGHAHIDVAWLWQISHTKEKCARTFSTADKFMDIYPDYRFIQSQPQLYAYMKEEYPQLYEKIKKRIKQGMWEAEGGMWVEADCNLISGESMVRQFLLGKAFFMEEFGVDSKILWLPDVFGYSAAMPQILQKCGVPYFMTTKISWNQFNDAPMDTFYLKGIDGSRVLTHFVTTPDVRDPNLGHNRVLVYKKTYNGFLAPWPVKTAWDKYKQKDINNEILVAFGFGDGGGGPTTDMLELADRLKDFPAMPKVRQVFVREFFDNIEANLVGKDVPEWWGELYLEYHRGTYTSQAKNKKFNRQSEFLYLNAETFAVANMLLGGQYPAAELDKNWKDILLNQFHDIIPGSSIAAVYEDSTVNYEQILAEGQDMLSTAIGGISDQIDIPQEAVVVFNPNSLSKEGLIRLKGGTSVHSVEGSDGRRIPVQHVNGEMVFYAEDLPQKGYKLYNISNSEMESSMECSNELAITKTLMENRFFRIQLDESGVITSIWDKNASREVLAGRANVLQAFEDKPMNFDAWDIDIYYTEKMWEVSDVESIEIFAEGPVLGGLRIKRRFMDSVISQNIIIYDQIPVIDFATEIDWKQQEILLKAAFPVDINSDRATYEIQYGSIERPTHKNTSWDMAKFEVCAHKWVDLSEGDYGVSLLNDCKYGHDIRGNQIRITLLKSAVYPDPNADKEKHTFTYSLYPHKGNHRAAKTPAFAYALNNPLIAKVVAPQKGKLPGRLSFVSVDSDNLIIEATKKAEKEDAIIVRLFDWANTRGEATLTFASPPKSAYECDMLEQNITPLAVCGNEISLKYAPFEIKTIKIIL